MVRARFLSRVRSATRASSAAWLVALASCGAPDAPAEDLGSTAAAIVKGRPATAYPEAVQVTAGLIPCSGVLLAPRVVLTAGHCRTTTPGAPAAYTVFAPNAGGADGGGGKTSQTSTGSRDWTTFNGDPATSSDTLLVFLDAPILLEAYPVIPEGEVAAGTKVVDVGRTRDGTITTTDDYVSATVTISGPGTSLGFPFNYAATPDLSEGGDSGGPIVVLGASLSEPHQVVAIVDTDTIEQSITEASPIDLFARLDVVRSAILAQVARAELADAGRDGASDARGDAPIDASAREEAGDARASTRDAAATSSSSSREGTSGSTPSHGAEGGGCVMQRGPSSGRDRGALLAVVATLVMLARARRRGPQDARVTRG